MGRAMSCTRAPDLHLLPRAQQTTHAHPSNPSPTVLLVDFPPGTLLGGDKYEVVDVLGRGGNGVTYRCRSTTGGGDVAIKCLSLRRWVHGLVPGGVGRAAPPVRRTLVRQWLRRCQRAKAHALISASRRQAATAEHSSVPTGHPCLPPTPTRQRAALHPSAAA